MTQSVHVCQCTQEPWWPRQLFPSWQKIRSRGHLTWGHQYPNPSPCLQCKIPKSMSSLIHLNLLPPTVDSLSSQEPLWGIGYKLTTCIWEPSVKHIYISTRISVKIFSQYFAYFYSLVCTVTYFVKCVFLNPYDLNMEEQTNEM
jgi:hypothetical protein